MITQISLNEFAKALSEMGHNPEDYRGKKMCLEDACNLYELDLDLIMDAINQEHLIAHYDYSNDRIWLDALEIAHFHYCVKSKIDLYKNYL